MEHNRKVKQQPSEWENISSVQFSHSVVSDPLRPHESQHARPPCPSPTPGVHSDSCPSSPWCHPAISSSVVPFSSCPQSLPASESFPVSQLFTWGGQSTGASASASFLPKKSQGWSPSDWTGWISLQSKGLSRVFSNTSLKASVLQRSAFFIVQLSQPYMTTGKTNALTRQTLVSKVMSLLFNMLSTLQIAYSVLAMSAIIGCILHMQKLRLVEVKQIGHIFTERNTGPIWFHTHPPVLNH